MPPVRWISNIGDYFCTWLIGTRKKKIGHGADSRRYPITTFVQTTAIAVSPSFWTTVPERRSLIPWDAWGQNSYS